jgi:hypothetical protein
LQWVEVTHPFHPLRGERFRVVQARWGGQLENVRLEDPVTGRSFTVPREWTDLLGSVPIPGSGALLELESLLALVDLVDTVIDKGNQ